MHVFKRGNYTQEGVKTESVKQQNWKSVASIDAMARKQESKAMKCTQTSRISQFSDNQPIRRRVDSFLYVKQTKKIVATVAFVSSYGLMDSSTWITPPPISHTLAILNTPLGQN